MNEHDATEISFKNGYKQGKADATREIFEDLESVIVGNQYGEAKILVDEYLKRKKKYTEEGA